MGWYLSTLTPCGESYRTIRCGPTEEEEKGVSQTYYYSIEDKIYRIRQAVVIFTTATRTYGRLSAIVTADTVQDAYAIFAQNCTRTRMLLASSDWPFFKV